LIHVATVHWKDDRWVEVQLRYLERFLPQPFRVYAFLSRLERDHSDRFFYSSAEDVADHATKLDLLADVIGFAAEEDDDPLLFIDGDAFPIAPVGPLVERLPASRLVAVRRGELGDPQPHPCFCLTTVGLWRELGADWHRGPSWRNAESNEVSDVGANLMAALERSGIGWEALLRSNRRNPHPLFFAVYGDVVYHHGGGFRKPRGGRVANVQRGVPAARESGLARFLDRLPDSPPTRMLHRRLHPVRRLNRRMRAETAALSREWFERIERDPDFFRELIEP
jgi:hypothetical protein